MDIPSTKPKSNRTARIKAVNALKKVPTALLLKRKAECDARALKIVERLMEPQVDVDWLLQSLAQINKGHMEDIVEERSIVKLCGYVLCDNPLTKVVNKKYQISTLRNKVYDIDRVKNFCSFSCYTATYYIMEQMSTSPLWIRDQEETPKFKILPKNQARSRSPPGVEVDLIGVKLHDDGENLEDDSANDSKAKESPNLQQKNEVNVELKIDEPILEATGNIGVPNEIQKTEENADSGDCTPVDEETVLCEEQMEKCSVGSCNQNEKLSTLSEILKSAQSGSKSRLSEIKSKTETSKPIAKELSESGKVQQRKSKESKKKTVSLETLMTRVEKSFQEWITEETKCLLHGEEAAKHRILESVSRQEKYAVLCKKLNHLQIAEERDDCERISELKPAPQFSALQDEAKGLELKVRAFYQGQTVFDKTAAKSVDVQKDDNEETNTVLPMIDVHAPKALRRRIFLDKLNKVLPDLLRALSGSGQITSSSCTYTSERCAAVKALVSTFSLSATNMIFRTAEWTLVALIIIKLLGIIDPTIKRLIASKQACMYTSMILMSYKLDSNYLDRLIVSLTTPLNTAVESGGAADS